MYACKFQDMLDKGVLRKVAILKIIQKLRESNLPGSKTSLYRWCREFHISTS